MDIEEYKKLAKNKLEADALVRQVRDVIKTTKWQNKDAREGFKESFQPLVSQFEKPEDPKATNIFTQNQKMIENQIQAIKDNKKKQKAREEIAKMLERLADMGEVTATPKKIKIEEPEDLDPWDQIWILERLKPEEQEPEDPEKQKKLKDIRRQLAINYMEEKFNGEELEMLKFYGLTLPRDFTSTNVKTLENQYQNLNDNIKELNGRILGRKNTKKPSPLYIEETNTLKKTIGTLYKYRNTIGEYFDEINYKTGSGINFYNSPQQLLKRLELLSGSLAAGNNGVLREYIQIVHQLKNIGVLNNNQLNKLLKSTPLNI